MDRRSEDAGSLADSIKAKLESLPSLSSKCCIYKVPNKLRRLNPDAYSPRVVSIGPFHHGKEELQAMEEHKYRYLQSFLTRTSFSLEQLVGVARTWEAKARSCYAEDVELNSDEFVKMLVVDGSFLVELMLISWDPRLRGENDRIYGKPWMINDVFRDMVLIENQLPYFVVKSLVGLLYQRGTDPAIQITHHFFSRYLDHIDVAKFKPEPDHFVDVLRSFILPEVPMKLEEITTFKVFNAPEATELLNAGVKFKPAETTSSCFLDIKFANGLLEIPTITVGDYTEPLYRNIIVFEQCHCSDKIFLDYITLLSCFIRSPADADILIRSEIFVNYLGNAKDVPKLFSSLCQEVVTSTRSHFQSLSEDLHAYCTIRRNRWKAVLRRDYFQNPWSVASVIAAVFLLILTCIQAICSILAL